MDEDGAGGYAPGEPRAPIGTTAASGTVTYIIDGTFGHRQDSYGGGGRITNGDTQWMTAGAGLLHRAPPGGSSSAAGPSSGIQLVGQPATCADKLVTHAIGICVP